MLLVRRTRLLPRLLCSNPAFAVAPLITADADATATRLARRWASKDRKKTGSALLRMIPNYQEPPLEPCALRPPRGLRGERPHPGQLWFVPLDAAPAALGAPISQVPLASRPRLPDIQKLVGGAAGSSTDAAAATPERTPVFPPPADAVLPSWTPRTRSVLVSMRRVCKTTARGRRYRYQALVVAGNLDGMVGFGFAKHISPTESIRRATARGLRSMVHVPRYDHRTVLHNLDVTFHRTRLEMSPRPPGYGLCCNDVTAEICRSAGIFDVYAKLHQSRNRINTLYATFRALLSQRNLDDIARARGLRIHNLRKLAYGF